MISCSVCGADVTGKKFCATCGHAVQTVSPRQVQNVTCPQCGGNVNPGAAFCMHCGSALHAQSTPASYSSTRSCPACQTQVAGENAFCTSCGHDMHAPVSSSSASLRCSSCGQQNASSMRFCGGCGSPLGTSASSPYSQPTYTPQYQQPAPQQYGQPQQYQQSYNNQPSYQQQPMQGQTPMVLRCPTCMAMAPIGTPNCRGCQTSLLNVVPTPANMPAQGQQGGFLQGNGGKYAMGALGGAAAVLGGEMLLHGVENSVENRVEGDMGFGGNYHHRHHHRREDEGVLGELGRLADDIGL